MLKTKITDFLNKYETRMEIAFFVGGFLFDIWMLAAPDEIFSIIQQIVYLAIIAMLIHFELLHRLQKWRPQGRLVKIWNYRTFILHFLLGSLLSVYSLFYIKSSSLFGSLIFLIFMISLLLANELPFVKKSNVSLKVGLYAICLFSFLSIVYPIAYGSIGLIPFFFSIITTLAIFYFHFNYLKNLITERYILIKSLLVPAYSIMSIFFVFYFLGWIPPVPLSVKSHGIYHFIEKKEGNYYLSFVDHFFSFLYPSDLEFSAQPMDKIYYYAQIYSPARISDEVVIYWYQKDLKGNWNLMDKIPLRIQGGRADGYRGFAFKSNYSAGKWKIEIRTSSGIEIARLYFSLNVVEINESRVMRIIQK